MNYEWNEIKAVTNKIKHGVEFSEAVSVFADENALFMFDDEHSDGEDRFLLLGKSYKERILLVVHCYKQDDIIRLISARKATKNETRQYNERKTDEKGI
ncbi:MULTISPECIES: BrnT family toxin [unclassified Campylobacter]|uniref:BrnT family toxin n=1 Tax=unclassified Campylobacter TaxID=2593542 RepID=UPI003D348219